MDASDIPLLEYNNIFVANLAWINRGVDKDIATFDLVVRELPDKWSFYLFDGLDRFIDLLLKHTFDERAVELLKKMNLIDSPKTEAFYRNFKFSGDVWSMKDGTIFFPGEPIVRVTAPLLEANLLTAFLLNVFSYPIRILTKTLRVKIASGDTLFYAGSLVRLPGFEQGLFALRAPYLLNSPNSSPLFYRKFPQYTPPGKITANINHAVIKSFPTERSAYRYVLDVLIDKANFFFVMVDTYDLKKGLDIFIEEIKKTKNLDGTKLMITIDSGDIKEQAFYVRKKLDENGLQNIRIQAMSNLDEYSIDEMVRQKTPIYCYITATALINVTDNPKLEAVYKLAELVHADGAVEQKAKLTKGKESYPGRKQVFRVYENGKMVKDIIGLEGEQLREPLLHKFVEQGKLVLSIPDLEATKTFLEKELQTLPDTYKNINKSVTYPVLISKKLEVLLEEVKKLHG